MKLWDVVVALTDLEGGEIKRGSEGTILDVYTDPLGYEVDFEVNGGDDWVPVSCYPHEICLCSDYLRKIT